MRIIGAVTQDTFHGKLPFYRGEYAEVCVTGLSRDKFTMGNIHGYLKKKRETARDIKRGIKLGCFDTPGQENQSGFFTGQHVSGKIDVDMAVSTLSKGKF